eukprot:3128672-Lingulodinium_polyedra.AAC.1
MKGNSHTRTHTRDSRGRRQARPSRNAKLVPHGEMLGLANSPSGQLSAVLEPLPDTEHARKGQGFLDTGTPVQ